MVRKRILGERATRKGKKYFRWLLKILLREEKYLHRYGYQEKDEFNKQ